MPITFSTTNFGSSESVTSIQSPSLNLNPFNVDSSPPDCEKDTNMSPIISALQKSFHPEFNFDDGNIKVETKDQFFRVHEYQLSKFSKMVSLIQEARKIRVSAPNSIKIFCAGESADFYNTFRVIYTPVIHGAPKFETDTLISALRIATTYDYPELRRFSIQELEKHSIPLMERIQLSDELLIRDWEKPAFTELCSRTKPISTEEAQILGMKRFVEVARIREAEQRRQSAKYLESTAQTLAKLGETPNPNISSRDLSLPRCDCQIVKSEAGSRSITLCQIHSVAPALIQKCDVVLKRHSRILEWIVKLKADVSAKQKTILSGVSMTSVENELNTASWIRRPDTTS